MLFPTFLSYLRKQLSVSQSVSQSVHTFTVCPSVTFSTLPKKSMSSVLFLQFIIFWKTEITIKNLLALIGKYKKGHIPEHVNLAPAEIEINKKNNKFLVETLDLDSLLVLIFVCLQKKWVAQGKHKISLQVSLLFLAMINYC